MKRKLLFLCFVIIPLFSFSQDNFGIFTGVTASSLSDGLIEESTWSNESFTLHFGGVYETQLSRKISFRPKIIYSLQGDRSGYYDATQSSYSSYYNNLSYETSYINVPLNFKFFNRTYILAGPQVGFLLKTEKEAIDFGELENIDYGLNVGFGRNIGRFFIEFNFYQGLNNLLEVDLDRFKMKATNTTFLLSLGYNFLH